MTGRSIKLVRKGLGLSCTHFSQVLCVHPTTLSRWENSTDPRCEGFSEVILVALEHRISRITRSAVRDVGYRVRSALLVDGKIAALAILTSFASGTLSRTR